MNVKVGDVLQFGVKYGSVTSIITYGNGEVKYVIKLDEVFKSLPKQIYGIPSTYPGLKIKDLK